MVYKFIILHFFDSDYIHFLLTDYHQKRIDSKNI